MGRFSRAFSPISPRSTPTPAHLPPSFAQAFKSFVANASAPSTSWRLSRLENGLRIFEEDASGDGVASPGPRAGSTASNRPATVPASSALGCKSVGLIFARPEQVFNLVMDLGPERASWDLTHARGEVVERLGDASDVVKVAYGKKFGSRQFELRRSWRSEPDGSFVLALSSADAGGGFVGGWVIAPFTQQHVAGQHAAASGAHSGGVSSPTGPGSHGFGPGANFLDAEFTSACLVTCAMKIANAGIVEWVRARSGAASLSSRVVAAQVAGLRELCEHTEGDPGSFALAGATRSLNAVSLAGGQRPSDQPEESTEDEDEDVFEDASSEASDDDLSDAGDADVLADEAGAGSRDRPGDAPGANTSRRASVDSNSNRRSSLGTRGSDPSRRDSRVNSMAFDRAGRAPGLFGGSLEEGRWPFEDGWKSANAWCAPDGDNFRVRGANYLRDRKKQNAGRPFAELVAVDWFADLRRMDDVCGAPGGTCQRRILGGEEGGEARSRGSLGGSSSSAAGGGADSSAGSIPGVPGERRVFAVNIQVPGPRHHSIVYYYVLREPPDPSSAFGKFWNGDAEYRKDRLKLIPNVALGPWVVQRAVGTKPLIVGRALKVAYHQTERYLEADIDIGSSAVANNVVRFVLGYVRTLVVDMCFLVEAKTEEELPERLIGTSRVAHLEPDAAVPPPPRE